MCLATNVADIVASFYLQCRSFDDLCNSYLHYVPNGLAEPNIIWYKARQSYAYVDCKDLLIMNGDDACSVNIQYYVVRFCIGVSRIMLKSIYSKFLISKVESIAFIFKSSLHLQL